MVLPRPSFMAPLEGTCRNCRPQIHARVSEATGHRDRSYQAPPNMFSMIMDTNSSFAVPISSGDDTCRSSTFSRSVVNERILITKEKNTRTTSRLTTASSGAGSVVLFSRECECVCECECVRGCGCVGACDVKGQPVEAHWLVIVCNTQRESKILTSTASQAARAATTV